MYIGHLCFCCAIVTAKSVQTPAELPKRKRAKAMQTGASSLMVITKAAAKDQKKEIAMRWADWFYTKEGDFYRRFGPEGTGMYTSNGSQYYLWLVNKEKNVNSAKDAVPVAEVGQNCTLLWKRMKPPILPASISTVCSADSRKSATKAAACGTAVTLRLPSARCRQRIPDMRPIRRRCRQSVWLPV